MDRSQPGAFLLLGLLLAAQTVEAQPLPRDRRVEEEKRSSLRPTLAVPRTPAAPEATKGEPPVPWPLEALYFANLAEARIAHNYDAAKSIVILMGVDQDYIDLSSQVAYLRDSGFLPRHARRPFDPMQPLRKGVAAHLFQRALGIRGGLALHVLGSSERYALKELVFQGLMSPGYVHDLVSGAELVQIMDLAAAYRLKRRPTRAP